MPDSLVDYLLFLAKSLTVFAVIGGLLMMLGRFGRAERTRSKLKVTDLGAHYDRLTADVQATVLPKAQLKQALKADRARRKLALKSSTPTRPRIFVLTFRGDLRASRVAGLREEVTAVLSLATAADEVVVRLENPGGTVNDQGLAASQLLRIRRRDIPLTICVDTVAASGGYLMACVANRIVAAPFAVVGSIGVVAQVPNFYRLLDRVGVGVEQFTGGEFKRTVTMFGENTEADRAKLTEQINETHDLFKQFVGAHRPQVDLAQVATGEYWYGTRALELNLVDELSTSDDYLLAARARAELFEFEYAVPMSRMRRLTGAAASRLNLIGTGRKSGTV